MSEVALPEGFEVGHWTNAEARTGCTVVLAPPGSVGGVHVAGGGPGTRETDVLAPTSNADEVSGVVLAGGSAYGLAAADGVVGWLEEQGRGYSTPAGRVPIVPAAVVYDLARGEAGVRPGREEGRAACEAARGGVPERGLVGAGTGCAAGKALGPDRATPTGIGYAAMEVRRGWTVCAVAAVNPVGDVLGEDGEVLAGPRGEEGEAVRTAELLLDAGVLSPFAPRERESTTLVCVCTNVPLSKTECTIVARMASAGIGRAVDPAFTPFDGDVVFCVSSEKAAGGDRQALLTAGVAAGSVVARSIRDAARVGD